MSAAERRAPVICDPVHRSGDTLPFGAPSAGSRLLGRVGRSAGDDSVVEGVAPLGRPAPNMVGRRTDGMGWDFQPRPRDVWLAVLVNVSGSAGAFNCCLDDAAPFILHRRRRVSCLRHCLGLLACLSLVDLRRCLPLVDDPFRWLVLVLSTVGWDQLCPCFHRSTAPDGKGTLVPQFPCHMPRRQRGWAHKWSHHTCAPSAPPLSPAGRAAPPSPRVAVCVSVCVRRGRPWRQLSPPASGRDGKLGQLSSVARQLAGRRPILRRPVAASRPPAAPGVCLWGPVGRCRAAGRQLLSQ